MKPMAWFESGTVGLVKKSIAIGFVILFFAIDFFKGFQVFISKIVLITIFFLSIKTWCMHTEL